MLRKVKDISLEFVSQDPTKEVKEKAKINPVDMPEIVSENSAPRCMPIHQKVLFVYTSAANNAVANIEAEITAAVAATNTAYDKSKIDDLFMIKAHTQQVNFGETDDIVDDLDRLINDATIQTLRNQHDADVVVLLVDADYIVNGQSVVGLAGDELFPAEDEAYAIVEAEYAESPTYTVAHEVAHLQGSSHHPLEGPFNPKFSNGYGHRFSYFGWGCPIFQWGTCYRATIMANPDASNNNNDYKTIKRFSNPSSSFNGEPTGTGTRNNFNPITSTMQDISDYRDANELRADIGISYFPNDEYTFSADPCGGAGSFSYKWKVTQTPLQGYGSVVSTSSSYNVTFNNSGDWFIRLEVNSSTGQQAFGYARVYVAPSGGGCGPSDPCFNEVEDPGLDESPQEFKLLPAYPNPFNPTTKISYQLPTKKETVLSVYDMGGRFIQELYRGVKPAGEHSVTFDASALSSGMYLVKIQAGDAIQTQKITLVK
jgi:hypothetical protein